MRRIQASEAKAHLPELLNDVERGETLIITRHGHPIARIIPEGSHRQREIGAAIDRIIARRSSAPRITIDELLSARDEGRP